MAKKTRSKKEIEARKNATIAKMKKNRQFDSDNLREVIKAKQVWVELELKKGEAHQKGLEIQLDKLKHQISQLKGIKLFIEDLLQPSEETKKE